jgi:tetratricopeptide (TPR) repeat protein
MITVRRDVKKRSMLATAAVVVVVAVIGGAVGSQRSGAGRSTAATVAPTAPATPTVAVRGANASLDQTITSLQAHLTSVPKDYPGWATLGLAYVQQAKVTVNSDYYPKAQGVLERSLSINDTDNFLAYAGLAALASARHDFAGAETQARKGLVINPYSPVLYGALGDALVQLGRYAEADAAIDKMASIRPDTASLARQSYLRELRGDIAGARSLMEQALSAAPTPADRAFALFQLGELDFNSGDPNAALSRYRAALDASPTDVQALAGKAKAEAALGQHQTAVDDYATVVARAPEPSIVVEFGELLDAIGRPADAQAQYKIVDATQKLFGANGVEPDAAPTLFAADHGQPAVALASSEKGIKTRPFLIMQDAYAWALHVNGRDSDALAAERDALQTGFASAQFRYHLAMIELSLGDEAAARNDLVLALEINPYFSPLAAPIARRTLDSLGTRS